MESSYLLISCAVNKNVEIANILTSITGIKEAIPVIGAYDCVVKTEEMTHDDVQNLVLTSIRPLDHVRSILTLQDAPYQPS